MRLVNELRERVQRLEKELASANNHIQFLSNVSGGGQAPPTQNTAPQKTLEQIPSDQNKPPSMMDQEKPRTKPKVTKTTAQP